MRFAGSPSTPYEPIGEVELLQEREFHYQGYETAAWWEKVLCQPQRVQLKSNGYWVSATFAGVVTDCYFGSLWGGVPIGGYDKSRDVGRNSCYMIGFYAYDFAKRRTEGTLDPTMLFHLDPAFGCGVEIVEIVESCFKSGEQFAHHFLTRAT